MSPYRGTATSNSAHELRLVEPISGEAWLLVAAFVVPFLLACHSTVFSCFVAVGAAIVASVLSVCRYRAWVVFLPREERVRVVRLRAFSYSAATLRLSDAMSVECSPVGKTMWLFVVAQDGRTARVIPASSRMLKRVQSALEDAIRSSDTRPEIPSRR